MPLKSKHAQRDTKASFIPLLFSCHDGVIGELLNTHHQFHYVNFKLNKLSLGIKDVGFITLLSIEKHLWGIELTSSTIAEV